MVKRRLIWCLLIGTLYLGMMGAGSCGKRAMEQIETAKDAVEEARSAQAPEYAPDEFRSAEESLLLAQKQYDQRRYRKSESTATDAETQARLAMELALEEKARREEDESSRREEEARLAYQRSSLFDEQQPTEEERARAALRDVHFGFDSSELSKAAEGLLALNAQFLTDHPRIMIEIEGHCDNRGAEEYNLALGARRAKAVYNYMVSQGIDPTRIRTISYGESVPLDPANNEEAWAKNRRAHFAVIQ